MLSLCLGLTVVSAKTTHTTASLLKVRASSEGNLWRYPSLYDALIQTGQEKSGGARCYLSSERQCVIFGT